jgi:hypothetical protein
MLDIIVKIFFISMLYISFTIQGVFEEKVYGKVYTVKNQTYLEEVKFRFTETNLNYFTVAFVSVLISGIIILSKKLKHKLFSVKDKVILGSLYTISKMSSENSMMFLDFISKTIGKSVKSLSSKY